MIQFACNCDMKEHRAPLEGYEISSGAIEKIPEILKNYNRIYMVADENTYKAAGARARKSSLAIEKMMKEFRKASIEAAK